MGRALAEWREDLIADLGGPEAVSTQQAAVVDLAVKTKLMLDSIDAWLLTQPPLVDRRRRAVLPVVRERQQLADALARYMAQLGLERRPRPVPTLDQYLAQRYGMAPRAHPAATGSRAEPAAQAEGQPPGPAPEAGPVEAEDGGPAGDGGD